MKIIVHDYAGHPFQVELSRQLANRGHSVSHLYFRGDPGPKGELERRPSDRPELSFRGVDLDHRYDKGAFIQRRFDDVAYGKKVAEIVAREKPDIVISGNTPTEAQSSILAACRKNDIGFALWVQDFYSIAVSKLLRKRFGVVGGLIGGYYKLLDFHQFRRADALVLSADAFRPLASKWAGNDDKIFVIENWGNLNDIVITPKDNPWSRRYNLHNTFNYLYSGTLGLKHNPRFLVDIARRVRGRANVVVVSQGLAVGYLYEEKSRDETLDNLIVLPLQPFSELSNVLGTADVTLSMIESDAGLFSVPSKVQSYFCAGKAVLLASPPENLASLTVNRTKGGLTVQPDDHQGFVDSAVRLLEDDALRLESGKNARDYALTAYDIERVTDQFESVFDYVLRTRADVKGHAVCAPSGINRQTV